MSELKLTGVLAKKFETMDVSSSFKKREFVIQTDEQYPQSVKFELMQDKCGDIDKHKEGDTLTVHFNVRGREWTSPKNEVKYFVSLNAWRIETLAASNETIIEDMETENPGTDSFSSELPF